MLHQNLMERGGMAKAEAGTGRFQVLGSAPDSWEQQVLFSDLCGCGCWDNLQVPELDDISSTGLHPAALATSGCSCTLAASPSLGSETRTAHPPAFFGGCSTSSLSLAAPSTARVCFCAIHTLSGVCRPPWLVSRDSAML